MIEPVLERLAGDADAKRGGLGEVGQPLPPRRMILAEDHLARRTGHRLPVADPPLQRAADADREVGMATAQLLEQRHRPQARGGLQHRHDLAVPDRGQRVGPAPAAGCRPFRWRAGIGLDPPAGAGAEARHCGRGGPAVGASERHVAPRLVVGDVRAGQGGDPPGMTAHSGTPNRHGTPPCRARGPPGSAYGRATPDLRLTPAPLILIDAGNHPDCRCARRPATGACWS